jgi:hypothetical protein
MRLNSPSGKKELDAVEFQKIRLCWRRMILKKEVIFGKTNDSYPLPKVAV